jgi:hypothetical protein
MNGSCESFVATVTGVVATDFVVLKGPATPGWGTNVLSTATDQITVQFCNLIGGNQNPNGVVLSFVTIH